MGWKSVTTFLTDENGDSALLDAAIALAERLEAHLDVFAMGIALTQAETFYGGANAYGLSGAFDDAAQQATEIETAARRRLEAVPDYRLNALPILSLGLQAAIGEAARFSDLVVAPLPYAAGRASHDIEILEACLFTAHVPVLVVPQSLPNHIRRVILAWNGSPEALRAAREALPLLRQATEVEIVVIDPASRGIEDLAPGQRLKEMLIRQGCICKVTLLESGGAPVSQLLQSHAKESGADLLVLGAYSHSRLRQAILGGATRSLLAQAEIPVFLAR